MTSATISQLNLERLANADLPYTYSGILRPSDKCILIRKHSTSNRRGMEILGKPNETISFHRKDPSTPIRESPFEIILPLGRDKQFLSTTCKETIWSHI